MKHKLYFFIFFFFFFFFFYSCIDKGNINTVEDLNAKNIYSKIMPLDFFIGSPYQLKVVDNFLITIDYIENKSIAIIDISNNKLVKRLLTQGSGPNEIDAPIAIDVLKNNIISVLERSNGRYSQYSLEELLAGNEEPLLKHTFENIDRITTFPGGYITTGFYSDGMFKIYDSNFILKNTVNLYSEVINELNDPIDKYRLSQGYIIFNEKSYNLMLATSFLGDFFTYNIADFALTEFSHINIGNNKLLNRIQNSNNTFIANDDTQHTLDAFSTNDFFYVLYSGKKMNQNSNFGKYILKFDNNGELKNCYKLDKDLRSFCVSENNRKIYGITLSPDLEYVFVEFEID